MTCIHRRNIRRLNACHTFSAARMLLKTTVIAVASAMPALQADAAPTGGVVTAGAGSISQQGNTTTITQAASQTTQPARMAINWNSFSSAPNESIIFNQPNTAAIALNRVTGTQPSELLGRLVATGQVFILNPNGVLFGASSQVNVRGLLASTLDMDNAGFVSGNYVLRGNNLFKVENRGNVVATDGGYVALVGESVANIGNIVAKKGDALLAAGGKVTLRLEGDSLIGYSIDLSAPRALVENGQNGVISASGGRIVLDAQSADNLVKEVVNNAGVLEAQTLEGKSGSIKLIGEKTVGKVQVGGTLDASAPNGDGNGGTILTSAARVKINDGTKITTAASSPTNGAGFLIVESTGFDIASDSGVRSDSSIGASQLTATLGTSLVTLSSIASSADKNPGDLNVNGPVAWTKNFLTLKADRNINFNATMRGHRILLAYGQASAEGGTADFYFNNGATIDLPAITSLSDGVVISQKGSNSRNQIVYSVINSLGAESGNPSSGTLQGITDLGANVRYVLGTDIDAKVTSDWNKGAGFTPLGELNGTLEGFGHTIKNLTIDRQTIPRPDDSILGLFGSVRAGALVHNLGITNASVKGNATVGVLAGSNLGTISNVHVSGTVSGTRRTGGLIGINAGTIDNSYSEANVTGQLYAGGLVGGNETPGAINGSFASGSVTAGDPFIPVVGNGPGYAGGLAAYSTGTIKGSYASGNTAATTVVGGLVGENTGTIEDSYAQGSVKGNSNVGGLVGLLSGTGTGIGISNSYATGAVQGIDNQTTHGLVGLAGSRQVSRSYWNTDAVENGGTGQSAPTPGKGEGKTGAQLRQAGTFGSWNIASTGGTEKTWRIYEDNSMPLLRSFLAPLDLPAARTVQYSGATQKNADIVTNGVRTGSAASGRNVGTYQAYSNQQGYDISNGELVITPKPLTIKAQIDTRAYDGTTSATAKLSDDSFPVDSVTTAYTSAAFDTKNVGEQKTVTVSGITISGANASNYTFQNNFTTTGKITPFNLLYISEAMDKVYDGTTNATVLTSAVKKGKDDVFANSIASFNNKDAGTGKTVKTTITGLGGADSGNYTFTQPANTTASIIPRPLDITATAADKVYDGGTAALALLQDNRIAGDLLTTSATASFDDKNAGVGKNVTVSGIAIAGVDAGNYRYQPQTLFTAASITPRPLDISATATDKSYDGNTQTAAALRDNRLAGDVLTASYQRADFADKNGGQNKPVIVSGIAIAGDDAANYKPNTEATTSASIKPISLVITANPDVRLANGIPYQGGNGVSYSGLLPGETAAVLDGKLSYGGSAQNAIKEGVYQITPRGLTSANYASTFVDGTLTIQPLPPGAGEVAAYTESGRVALSTYADRSGSATVSSDIRSSNSATVLSVADCGMRLPDNLMLGGCQSSAPLGSIGR